MDLRGPKSLEKLSARVMVKNLIRSNEKHLSTAKSLTNKEIILKFQDQIIPNLKLWWSSLPLSNFSLKKNLQEAIDELTEVDPGQEVIGHPVLRLFNFLLKTLTLEEVFLDKNYSRVIEESEGSLEDTVDDDYDDEESDDDDSYDDSDIYSSNNDTDFPDTDDDSLDDSKEYLSPERDENICEITEPEELYPDFLPYCLTLTAISLINTWREFPITKLTLYGYIDSEVIMSLLERCPYVEVLSVSDINLNGDVMVSIGNNCHKLKNLKLVGCSASKTSCTKAFFKNATIAAVRNAFSSGELISLSFPEIKILDLGFRGVWSIKSFELKKWILFYYKSLCVFNFDFIYDSAVNPLRLIKMNMDNLYFLRINYEFIYKFSYQQLDKLLKSLANLKNLEINCCHGFTESDQFKAEENLGQIASTNKILKYSVEYHINEVFNVTVINPMLKIIGANVISISIEIQWHVKVLLFQLLENIFANCPSMEILKLLFSTTNSIAAESSHNKKFEFQHKKLKELWLHEVEPWVFSNRPAFDDHMSIPWVGLLNFLERSLPDLSILSLTVWDKVSDTLDHLASNVTTFHLKHSSYRDEIITTEQILKVVQRFPYLQNLYLEGMDWKVFWKVKNYLESTNIKISWGSLDGWPECNWPCGIAKKTSEILEL